MTRVPTLFVAIAVVLLLQACTPTVRTEQMTATSTSAPEKQPAGYLRRNIVYVGGTGAVDRAIEGSLRQADLLDTSGSSGASVGGRYALTAQLVKLEEPSFGASMTVTASVRYVLKERTTGTIALDKTITTPYTASWDTAFVGAERKKLAGEGAFKANIAELMEELGRLNPPAANAATPPVAPVLGNAEVAPPARAARDVPPRPQETVARTIAVAAPEPEHRNANPTAAVPTVSNPSRPAADAVDTRVAEAKKIYSALAQQAKTGKIRYLQAARQYKEKFLRLYPEEVANPVINEYLAFMAVLGERVDNKKLTEVEAEYELARKERELAERIAAMRAQSVAQAAAVKATEESSVRAAAEQAAARRAGEDAAFYRAQLESQRLAAEAARVEAAELETVRQQAAFAAQQAQADSQRRIDLIAAGLRLLTPPPPPRMTTTTCRWFAQNWVCT